MSDVEDDFELILPDEDNIDIVDDTPEADRGRPVAAAITEDEPQVNGESDEEYGERVKKRIAKETAKTHAERRAKEQAIREREEAVAFAQRAMQEAYALRQQTSQYEQGFVHAAKGRAETEIEQAQSEYQRAFEQGDSLGMATAMKKMSQAAAQKSQFDSYVPQQVATPQQAVPPQQVQQQAPVQKIDREEVARQAKFMRENLWFNADPEMTTRALAIDEQIRNNPQTAHIVGTDEYYDYIDAIMRREFKPDRFGSAPQSSASRPQGQGVAPVSRASPRSPSSKTRVTLTESQVKLARRLGITPQQYAAQLIKEMK